MRTPQVATTLTHRSIMRVQNSHQSDLHVRISPPIVPSAAHPMAVHVPYNTISYVTANHPDELLPPEWLKYTYPRDTADKGVSWCNGVALKGGWFDRF